MLLTMQSFQAFAFEDSEFGVSGYIVDMEKKERSPNTKRIKKRLIPEVIYDVDYVDSNGRTALHLACQSRGDKYSKDQLDLVKKLISQGANVNAYSSIETPLHSAVRNRHGFLIALELIKAGADVNALDHSGSTPINVLLRMGGISRKDTPKLLDVMIKAGVTVNAEYKNGNTLLHTAVRSHPSLIERLIEAGANVNVLDKLGKSPLHHLTQLSNAKHSAGLRSGFKALIEAGSNTDILDKKMMSALTSASVDGTRLLLESGVLPDGPPLGYPPIHHASLSGDEEKVRMLIAAGADVNVKWSSRSTMSQVYAGMRKCCTFYERAKTHFQGKSYIKIADLLLAAGGGSTLDKLQIQLDIHPLQWRGGVRSAVIYGFLYSPIILPGFIAVISFAALMGRRTRVRVTASIAATASLLIVSIPFWLALNKSNSGWGLSLIIPGVIAICLSATIIIFIICFILSYFQRYWRKKRISEGEQ